jgi:hypothetical protein
VIEVLPREAGELNGGRATRRVLAWIGLDWFGLGMWAGRTWMEWRWNQPLNHWQMKQVDDVCLAEMGGYPG